MSKEVKKSSKPKVVETKKVESSENVEVVTTKTETFENSSKDSVLKVLKTVWNFAFWIIIIGLLCIWVTDFVRTKKEEKPIFCIAKNEYKYDDGVTYECIGLGYKVYTYNRSSLKIKSQFSPFFVKMEE